MTLIGAFRCMDGVVLFADRQETITDYAKWDVGKIKLLELVDTYRLLMAGAGDSDMIDMIWSQVHAEWRKDLRGSRKTENQEKLKDLICRVVATTTKKCMLPYPARERPWADLIWAIQNTNPQFTVNPLPPYTGRTDLFRTSGLKLLPIGDFYATGNPVFLMHYLEDLFIKGNVIGLEEAEALSAYLLWEAGEFDPTCGKHSDVFILRDDASIGRMTKSDERYWEEHFEHLKRSLRLIPLLSCALPTPNRFTIRRITWRASLRQ
jgi:hypothetical protein